MRPVQRALLPVNVSPRGEGLLQEPRGEPRYGPPLPRNAASMESDPALDTGHTDAAIRVLVVDDEPMVRRVLVALLARMGAVAESVEGGAEAIDLVRGGHQFGVILLDLSMPGLSGAETFRELQRIAPHIPVVICSGYAPPDSFDPDMRSAVAGMIAKPFTPGELQRVLEHVGVLPAGD